MPAGIVTTRGGGGGGGGGGAEGAAGEERVGSVGATDVGALDVPPE